MAFIKRTWLARIGTGLNKFLIGTPDGQGKQTLTNSPDSVTQQGDVISADNLNDLEDRIEAGFNGKQDTLTFDNTPTQNSNNPVKSGGLFNTFIGKMEITKLWDNTNYTPNPTVYVPLYRFYILESFFGDQYASFNATYTSRFRRADILPCFNPDAYTQHWIGGFLSSAEKQTRTLATNPSNNQIKFTWASVGKWYTANGSEYASNANILAPIAIWGISFLEGNN